MAAAHDFSTWPRRKEAAKRIGKSVAQLRRYEGKRINPIKDKNGENRFDPEELDKLAAHLRKSGTRKAAAKAKSPRTDAPRPAGTRDTPPAEPRVSGAVTKRAFEMFEQNYSRARVAIELEESVENVNWLHENYLVMSGKMDAAAAQRAVRGERTSGGAAQPQQPARRPLNESELRSRPRSSLDPGDLEHLLWIEEIDARKQRYIDKRRAVLVERQAALPTEEITKIDDAELYSRPRESLTHAEREYVEVLDEIREREVRSRSVGGRVIG